MIANQERTVSTVGAKKTNSRRDFLGRTLPGSLAAVGMGAMLLRPSSAKADHLPPDIAILNYALTLEHLEAAFYLQGLQRFTARDFCSGQRISQLGPKVVRDLHKNLLVVRDHEVEHVMVLESVIQSLGRTPVLACQYDFGYDGPDGFLRVAQALENTGVMAYTGALAQIQNVDLQTAGATIATVEARHASYLNLINGDSPFPMAFDEAKTMDEILAIAGQFIVSCP